MTRWHQRFGELTEKVDDPAAWLLARLQRGFGADPLYIQPYLGYGTADVLYVRGRVLAGEKLRPADANDNLWDNLAATYRRFETDEMPYARVQAQIGQTSVQVTGNQEGCFAAAFQQTQPLQAPDVLPRSVWMEVALALLAPSTSEADAIDQPPLAQTTTRVIVPPPNSDFGIISDLDDTVLQTNVASLVQTARMTFLQNARTRLPFAGVAQFYQALQAGPQRTAQNPIFYVSSSPWNLYDLLVDFLDFQGIPAGPLFLRDLGYSRQMIHAAGHHSHKLAQVTHLLAVYPHLPFILIGDSGQEDPEIYREVIRQFPKRIAAIYIRDVSLEQRDVEIDAIIQEVGKDNVPMLRVADTVAAAEHAVTQGFIPAAALPAIQGGKQMDKST